MIALDTNIYLYSHDNRDPAKQQKAQLLVKTAHPLALAWQVGCEFVFVARKLQPYGFSQQDAWDALKDMQAMAQTVLLPVPDLWVEAEFLLQRFSLSYWDSLLIAACKWGGVTTLYSEDMGHAIQIDMLTIVNPFLVP